MKDKFKQLHQYQQNEREREREKERERERERETRLVLNHRTQKRRQYMELDTYIHLCT